MASGKGGRFSPSHPLPLPVHTQREPEPEEEEHIEKAFQIPPSPPLNPSSLAPDSPDPSSDLGDLSRLASMADKETKLDAEGAVEVEQEEDYESDLDDAPLPAVRRRAAASDEEEGEDSEEDGGLPLPRRKAGSDEESDGQGAAEVYDQELYEEEEDEGGYEEYEEDFEQGRGGVVAAEAVVAPTEAEGVKEGGEAGETAAGEEVEGKKESEPFAVPTTGAFYMHDDRFQEARGRGRGRRMLSNRKLWPKEEQEWVHDRFDEMHPRDYNNGNIRNLRGRFRGRGGGPGGRTRGVSRGNFRGGNRSRSQYHDGNQNYCYVPKGSHISHDNTKNSRQALPENVKTRAPKPSQAHNDDVNNFDVVPKESRTYYADSRNQPSHKNTPRVIRGRGSKRYQPRWRSTTELSSEQNNKSQNPENASSNANLGKQQPQNSNSSRPGQGLAIKQSFASNLNSASPPFYPSRPPHRELPAGPSVGLGEAGTGSPALHSSPSSSNSQFPIATNQVIRDSVQSSHPVVQQWSVQSSTQSTPRMPSQMFRARIGISDEMPSSTQAVSTVTTEDTGISSPRGSNKVIPRMTVKGHHGGQGEEHAPFLYGRGQVLGATGSFSLGDQGFHGTPALFPVMQFGGQHPGRPGVPSIGMALPGFVSHQQLGLSNSEMAWLPILAGSSGGLGATYGSPYIAMDGNYYSRPSEQESSSVSPREPSAVNAPSQLKSPEITELVNDELIQHRVVNDELSQRRNKPRRYSEMNFGQ